MLLKHKIRTPKISATYRKKKSIIRSTETRIFTARKLRENGNRRDGRQRVSQKRTIPECK